MVKNLEQRYTYGYGVFLILVGIIGHKFGENNSFSFIIVKDYK